ncbi:MAG: ATP-binding protein [Patescibacteria group bacterium]
MDTHIVRRIKVIEWIIKARWFYMSGIFIIGILSKTLSESNVSFPFSFMIFLLVSFFVINLFFYFSIKRIKKNYSHRLLSIISHMQIIIELGYFIIIMHLAGGIESISTIFFFLVVVSASLIFGARGSIITAIISAVLVNLLVIFEYYGIISHISRYGVATLEFQNLQITLTKTVTTSIFYLIVGLFGGFGSNLLLRREDALEEKTQQLNQKTKLLAKREEKLSEINQQLIEERNKISAIINNFIDPIIFIDKEKKISLFNPAAKEILNLASSVIGKKIESKNNFSLLNFNKIIKNKHGIKRLKDKVHGYNTEEIKIIYHNQDRIYKVITAKVSREDEVNYGHIKVFYDITREKMIDKLKSEFISIAAHQLRTPLSAIKWITKMVLDEDSGKLNKSQKELLTKGYRSNERIIRLVDDLLNVSRIEEGRFGYKFSETNFQEIVNAAIENSERIIAKNHINLKINKPKKLPKVYIDKDRMILVMQNLLDNATKYTPEHGKIIINIAVAGNFLEVRVIDNGVGVPKKEQSKLFTKFFRAPNVMRMQTEGTGLGLFIVKNIIEKHRGSVKISSEEGKGTEVFFTVPINN